MPEYIDPRYPDVPFLREKARKRIPGFAFDYLDGGCNSEINLHKNTAEIREVELRPYYLREFNGIDLKTEMFGHTYDAPFGMSPIGLQGLMWPKASEILAKAAFDYNIPFILSTVATASIETIGEITEGKAWFQLYHPKEDKLRNDLLSRAEAAGYKTLVVLSDVPTFGYRAKEIRNGLSIPPRMTLRNMYQIATHPSWALSSLISGLPQFKTMEPYIPKGMNLKHLGLFMNKTFDGRLTMEKLKELRELWKGSLVLKGVATEEDTEKCIELGVDGIIVSNHGGRQLDCGESTIHALDPIAEKYKGKIRIMMDSGIRTGPDVINSLAKGAEFTFLGRSFMYGVSALGKKGGEHTISIIRKQTQQVMEQLNCARISELNNFIVK